VTPAWVVQVASLSKESGARDLRDRLRKQGFSAYVDRFDDKGKVYYRVRVGPKLTRAGAEAQQAKILKVAKLKGIVVPYK
jgi:DedD protein